MPSLKAGDGGRSPEIRSGRGPQFSHVANWCARLHARSLRFPERILTVFVQALDFNTVEALVSTLQPSAKGSRRPQILNCISKGLSGSRETAILGAATLRGFGEEQLSGSVTVLELPW